ncbi:MAG: site-specific integrase [Proteobacteria bacterium]|nr:site-specific integrase [Pseudomonadota bacterium]
MSSNNDFFRLWQHDNGYWYVIWSTGQTNDPHSWGTKRISAGTTDRKEAEQFRAQYIAGLNNPAPPAEPTIGYLLERYWEERGQHTRSPKTIQRAFKKLIPFFGQLLPSHVSNQLFRKFADEHKGTSHGSIIRWLGILKAALRYAEGSRWIEPLPPFKMPVNHPPPRDLWLTREQVATLIKNAKSPHVELFIKMAAFTGARSGSILDLTWEQVDMEHRIINFGHGWGNKRRAIVPMNDALYESLLTARELAQSDHVIEFNGKPLKSVKKAFERLCKACNIKASPHVLRHTAATWLVMDGVPLREVARLLGNSEAMVEKVYGKHAPDYLRRAVAALSLNNPPKLEL